MSSSAPKLQPASPVEAASFCYGEAQPSESASTEQAGEERARRQQAEAFEQGRASAQQEFRSALDGAMARSRDQILHALADFGRERASYYRRIEGEVVQLALAIARKILHREVQVDPHALAGIVRVTLEKLDSGTTVDLHVHPAEVTEWRHYFACQAEGTPAPEVHEDPAIPAGECRIETSLGSTEVGLELQLKEIETGLLDLLAQRPDTGPGTSSSAAANSVAGLR